MFNKNVHRSDFKEAIINSLMMFLFMIVFSIIGVFFIFTRIGGLLDLLIGVAFIPAGRKVNVSLRSLTAFR